MTWYETVQQMEFENQNYVIVTVIGTVGSTPRDCGTKMVISKSVHYATIGGGHLEYKAIDTAKQMLAESSSQQKIEHFPLGAKLGQCCGGHATLMFESFINDTIDIMLFGAGHVGKALVSILAELPCRIYWVDSREDEFPKKLPSNVVKIISDTPSDEVASMPKDSYYIVMTHNHPLDFDITEAILLRNDSLYVGLIGSNTKLKRFQMRFKHKGYKSDFFSFLHCPIGLADVPGKRPTEVAVAVAGEIIANYHHNYTDQPQRQGVDWQQLKISDTSACNIHRPIKQDLSK